MSHKETRHSNISIDEEQSELLSEQEPDVLKLFCCSIKPNKLLKSHWNLPTWLQDNEYLKHFHRPVLETISECFKSMFALHTETGNIWTHFLGFWSIFIITITILIRPIYDNKIKFPVLIGEKICFVCFLIGASLCLSFSWLFHTLACCSYKMKEVMAKLDYSGISALIVGSNIPVIYYGFFCYPKLIITYTTVVSLFGISTIIMSLLPKISSPKYRPLRGIVFLVFGLSAIISIIHVGILYEYKIMVKSISLYHLICMGSSYVIGAIIYITRVPERFFIGKINVLYQSHQLFHICVVIGAHVHIFALYEMSKYRSIIGKTC